MKISEIKNNPHWFMKNGCWYKIRGKYAPQIYITKICNECGEQFAASHDKQVYCSNSCGYKNNPKIHHWRKGKKFTNERGGVGNKRLATTGYVEIYLPGHPLADKKGRVLEHRLVMLNHVESSYTKPLSKITAFKIISDIKNSIVHHINGVRSDNRIENLVRTTKSQHNSIHKKEEVKSRIRNKNGTFKRSPSTG